MEGGEVKRIVQLTPYEKRLTRNALLPTDQERRRREREFEVGASLERERVALAEKMALHRSDKTGRAGAETAQGSIFDAATVPTTRKFTEGP